MPIYSISSEKKSDKYLEINNCAEQFLIFQDHDTLRINGRVDFGLQYIAEGRCYYEDSGVEHCIEKGFALLQFPGVRQHYYFKKEDKTTLLWCHFSGKLCDILDKFNHGKTVVVDFSRVKHLEYNFYRMISTYNIKAPYYEVGAAGYMAVIISTIAKSLEYEQKPILYDRYSDIDKVINYIYSNFNKQIELEELANMCHLSKSRFVHLFKQYTGVAPYHFQMSIRIERAIDILSSETNVTECANMVGYKDPSYFCRIFKKYTSQNPTDFKKN